MKKGWARIHRQIEDNPLYFLEPFTKAQAWMDLVIFANHSDGEIDIRGNIIKIKRGQIGWSEITLAQRWDWSKGKVRRFLKFLESRQQISQVKDRYLTTIITISNYEDYQSDTRDTADSTADDTAERQQTVQQTDSRRYINKKNKKNKNEKNDKTGEEIDPESFAIEEPQPHLIKTERAPGVFLSNRDIELLTAQGISELELKYWLGQMSNAALKDPRGWKKYYKDHRATALSWRSMRFEKGLVWDETSGAYLPRGLVKSTAPKKITPHSSKDPNEVILIRGPGTFVKLSLNQEAMFKKLYGGAIGEDAILTTDVWLSRNAENSIISRDLENHYDLLVSRLPSDVRNKSMNQLTGN